MCWKLREGKCFKKEGMGCQMHEMLLRVLVRCKLKTEHWSWEDDGYQWP